jgi:hypothetical protein
MLTRTQEEEGNKDTPPAQQHGGEGLTAKVEAGEPAAAPAPAPASTPGRPPAASAAPDQKSRGSGGNNDNSSGGGEWRCESTV